MATEEGEAKLLDYLNCAFRTLGFTCSADKTLADVDWNGFPVFYLKDAYWTSVYAGFASSTLIVVNNYLYHVYTSRKFDSNPISEIKVFRSTSEFLHVVSKGFR